MPAASRLLPLVAVCLLGWSASTVMAQQPAAPAALAASAASTPATPLTPASTPAPVPAADTTAKAGEFCEAAVSDTVKQMRGQRIQDVQFPSSKRSLTPTSGDDIGVKGEGRYLDAGGTAIPFTYTCAFNTRTGGTSGVLFRETGTVRPRTEPAWTPDLTRLSPEACETAVAATLKQKYPRVDRITFDSGSRQIHPAPYNQARLEGRLAMARAPGMNTVTLPYQCVFDPRNGRVLSAQSGE